MAVVFREERGINMARKFSKNITDQELKEALTSLGYGYPLETVRKITCRLHEVKARRDVATFFYKKGYTFSSIGRAINRTHGPVAGLICVTRRGGTDASR